MGNKKTKKSKKGKKIIKSKIMKIIIIIKINGTISRSTIDMVTIFKKFSLIFFKTNISLRI